MIIISLKVPSAKKFQAFTVQRVTPSAADLKQVEENIISKQLCGGDDFWDGRAVEKKLDKERIAGVCKRKDQVTENGHRDRIVDGQLDKVFSDWGKGGANEQNTL